MKAVIQALKSEQKQLSKALKKVESLLARAGGGVKRRAGRKTSAGGKKAVGKAAKAAKKAGSKKATKPATDALAEKRAKKAALLGGAEE